MSGLHRGVFGAYAKESQGLEIRERYKFRLAGYVVMPDHVHLLIGEPPKGTPSVVQNRSRLTNLLATTLLTFAAIKFSPKRRRTKLGGEATS